MAENTPQPSRRWPLFLAAFVLGIVATLGVGAAVSATDTPEFCGSCHSMAPATWTHQMSIHAEQTCNDCHTPHNLAAKLPYKAKVGLHDIFVTVTGTIPDTIHASAEMKQVIQDNCIRCHYATVQNVDMTVKPFCTDCHKAVPHNGKLPISEREAADV